MLLEELEGLSIEQTKLFFSLLSENDIDISLYPIPRQKIKLNESPLTFSQQHLWINNQLKTNVASYNMAATIRLVGNLRIDLLEKSFIEIIKRHHVLRSCFVHTEEGPLCKIEENIFFKINQIDLSHIHIIDQRKLLKSSIKNFIIDPFNLTAAPLLRVSIIKLSTNECILLFCMHHIISDAWSVNIICRELNNYYKSFIDNKHFQPPDLKIEYSDYAFWEQQLLSPKVYEKQSDYWKKQLSNIEFILNLPIDMPRPSLQKTEGARLTFNLSPSILNRIQMLCNQNDITVFMFLLATFTIMLSRYSGQQDILIGVPIANRRKEWENLIGYFANVVVMRNQPLEKLTVTEFLENVRKVVIDAFENQHLPFEKLLDVIQPPRDLSRHPLFQVMLVFNEFSDSRLTLHELEAEYLKVDTKISKFDLTLAIEDTGQGLDCEFEYSTSLFHSTTIARMVNQYLLLIENILNDSKQNIGNLKMMSEKEEQKLLSWSDASGLAKNKCIHHLFEEQADKNPNEIAISFNGIEVTYQELNRRSNMLAHGLISSGLNKAQPVAILLEDPIQQIFSILSILKAGGIFTCLDSAYPTNRLKQILKQVVPKYLLTDFSQMEAAYILSISSEVINEGTNIIDISCQNSYLIQCEQMNVTINNILTDHVLDTNPQVDISPGDPLYIVYTSGSTGIPKGILQSHSSSSQYMEWQSRQFNIQAGKRVGQWASIAYDAAYSEIFGALCFGATLCINQSTLRGNPQVIANWLLNEKINVIQLVPSFCKLILEAFKSFSDEDYQKLVLNLDYVLLAGERLPLELATHWQNLFQGRVHLYNLYGPSEIVLATQYHVTKESLSKNSIPIGYPFAGRQILILDENKRLCPIGIPGEIYIRSPYLTIGYYNQIDETDKVYIQNPLHNDFEDRVYKTGDRGRWLNFNEIEFLERVDNQIKIRGNRVELGEIERVLNLHKSVIESAVIANYRDDGFPFLVAYVVVDKKFPIFKIREYLTKELPAYMVPSYFMILNDLPYTITGKVDRKSLPRIDRENLDSENPFQLPFTQSQKTLARIWQELLQVDKIGINDNFFDLGGDSLMLAQLQLKLNSILNINIQLVDLFRHPTINLLSQYLISENPDSESIQLSHDRGVLRKKFISNRRLLSNTNSNEQNNHLNLARKDCI